ARDQFLSIASHELRTPVTSVQGYTELLLRAHARGWPDPARTARYLQALEGGTKRLAALTQDLLDVSRLHSGQFPLRSRPFDLAALAARGVAAFRDRLGSGHTLTVETACNDCPLVGDPDRLEQVLTNLLENAVKYSPDGGPIRVMVRPDDAGMLLAVRDEGIGLPPGLAEAIFVPFGRAPNAAGRQIPGLGLGLHICREIVERHGGRIWAESAGEGRGTTVNVWLPAGNADGRSKPVPE
ncbi:MAG: HAMP domain-containing histidine kinase, partial [Chloroflexota bacterium]|nr:HAMP domain-containing histidine kinase [Chloroflexota bacterium]